MKSICDATSPVKKDSFQQEALDTVKRHRENMKKLERELNKPSQDVAVSIKNVTSSRVDMQKLVTQPLKKIEKAQQQSDEAERKLHAVSTHLLEASRVIAEDRSLLDAD